MKINRLLANLPFNPSLIGHVSYYAKRLHKEESIRRIGLIMTILAILVQMVAIITPAKQSFAAANGNDIVYGGGDKNSFVSAIQNNSDGLGRRDIRAIYEYYLGSNGAAERAIQSGVEETIVSSTANNFWSIGRTTRDGGDIQMSVPGAQTGIYQRTLAGWGLNASWRAIRVKSSVNFQDMWILEDCGNIVTRGPYTHDSPNGHLDKTSVPVPNTPVKPGQTITYNLLFGNNGPGNMLGTTIFDRTPANTTLNPSTISGEHMAVDTYTDDHPGTIVRWAPNTYPEKLWAVDQNNHLATFSVTVNQGVPEGTQICNNDARLSWIDNGQPVNKWLAYNVCHTVTYERCQDGTLKPASGQCMITCPNGTTKVAEGQIGTCPKPKCTIAGKTDLNADDANCKQTPKCQYDSSLPADSPNCKKRCAFNGTLYEGDIKCCPKCPYNTDLLNTDERCKPPTTPKCQYNQAIPATDAKCKPPCQYNSAIFADDAKCHAVCQYNGSILDNDAKCKPKCQYDGTLFADDSKCKPPLQTARCESLKEIANGFSRTEHQFEVKSAGTNGAQIIEYQFDYNADGTIDKTIPALETNPVIFSFTYPDKAATYHSKVYVKASLNAQATKTSEFCTVNLTVAGPPTTPKKPLITVSKRVANLTKKIDDANGTTASASDQLEYSFIIKNIGDGDMVNYTPPTEDISDVLEYAAILSPGDGTLNQASKTISWPNVTVAAGQTITKKISVVVKNPIPVTPVSTSTPKSFDLLLQNTYGNETTIKLDKPLPKQVENINRTLPNTGPGLTITLGFFGTMIVAYFFMRSRILAKELDYVRSEYAAGSL